MKDRVINIGFKCNIRKYIHPHPETGRCSSFQVERELAD